MPKGSRIEVFIRWLLFTVVLSLLQLWVFVAFRFFQEQPINVIRLLFDGGLIFYANAIAMDVLAKRWDEFRLIANLREGGLWQRRNADIIYSILLPLSVLLIAVVMYCALLSKSPPSNRILWGQGALIVVALTSSLVHSLTVAGRFEVSTREG